MQGNTRERAQTITDAETITGTQNTLERAYFRKLESDQTRRAQIRNRTPSRVKSAKDPEPIKRAEQIIMS